MIHVIHINEQHHKYKCASIETMFTCFLLMCSVGMVGAGVAGDALQASQSYLLPRHTRQFMSCELCVQVIIKITHWS